MHHVSNYTLGIQNARKPDSRYRFLSKNTNKHAKTSQHAPPTQHTPDPYEGTGVLHIASPRTYPISPGDNSFVPRAARGPSECGVDGTNSLISASCSTDLIDVIKSRVSPVVITSRNLHISKESI